MSESKILALGSDHAGYDLKQFIKNELIVQGFDIKDFGCYSPDSVDYPDIIHPLAQEINEGRIKRGIILCGTGIGVSIVANKYPGVRAALCFDVERARLSRRHNDANILALGARFISTDEAMQIIRVFLETEFEGGRHQQRVAKIPIS